jgi:SAM-dependent methyltransferase
MGMMARRVESERLDTLPPSDPRALRARRDLARINAWMGQVAIMAWILALHAGPAMPRTMLDIGCGDGRFLLRVARSLSQRWSGVTAVLLDRQDIVSAETRAAFRGMGWDVETPVADGIEFLERCPRFDIVTANLVLHHFSSAALSRLLSLIAQCTPLFVACEPRRSRLSLWGSRLVWMIGCGEVARHDAVVSVRAGFADHELSAAWPGSTEWNLHEGPAGPFTHCFVAKRRQRNDL